MTLIHQFDFEVTTQHPFGFPISDHQAIKPLKLPINSRKKKYLFSVLGKGFSYVCNFLTEKKKAKSIF